MDGYLLDENACTRLGKLFKLHESGRLVPKDNLGTLESLATPDLLRRPFKNDSGTTIPAYGVVMLDDKEKIDEIEYLKLKKADDKFKRRYFVNGTQEVEDQQYGWGTWLTHSDWVLYDKNEGAPQIGEQWGVKPGEFKLFKNRPGFFITGGTTGESSTDDLRVRAIQQTVEEVIGQPDTLIDYLSFGDVTVYVGDAGFESSSGLTIENCFNGSRDIPTGEPVRVIWPNGQPFVLPFYHQIQLVVKPTDDIAKGDAGQCVVFQAGFTTGTAVTAIALGAAVKAGRWCVAWQETASGVWFVGPWECG